MRRWEAGLWRVVATRNSIQSTPLIEGLTIGQAPLVALGIASVIAAPASWNAGHGSIAEQVRTE
jgi:hypothetical protein